ncbi:hypothetical protein [Naumannella halotolerans]|uniref:Uncharacterized protein n=1 Tax=Naumannella halotolerans TaxID=993414 RepID=A0A4R7J167_9ACTN|nr:hypothetical protein [Naumannella halotolerans]TDT30882.1 hypothetical protein CLV29_2289 [Naumannella halotolerans]
MLSSENRSRPAGNRAANKINAGTGSTYSVVDLDAMAAQVDGAFVVLVRVADDRYRRRVFLTVKSAENHARKAQQRGQDARIFLCELKPLVKVCGLEAAPLPGVVA